MFRGAVTIEWEHKKCGYQTKKKLKPNNWTVATVGDRKFYFSANVVRGSEGETGETHSWYETYAPFCYCSMRKLLKTRIPHPYMLQKLHSIAHIHLPERQMLFPNNKEHKIHIHNRKNCYTSNSIRYSQTMAKKMEQKRWQINGEIKKKRTKRRRNFLKRFRCTFIPHLCFK